MQRYQSRLLAFCRHMLGSQEDAEDVLQEVFAASFNALLGDNRPINARPWLYRIARNRCLNHLRRPRASGQDSMDIFEIENGTSTAETVHRREEFRQIVADVQELPETQRTALLLREIDALSYDQIAEAMDTTVPSVKSLLVRARVGLAEASEARLLTCEEVRIELAEVAEGLSRTTAPARRHLKNCERCRTFRSELKTTSKALAAVLPIGPLIFFKKLGIAHLGFGGGSAAGSMAAGSAATGGAGIAAGGAAAGGAAAGGAISAGVGTLASKAAAGMAAAVIVTAGAVEVNHVAKRSPSQAPAVAQARPAPAAPAPVAHPDPAPAAKPAEAEKKRRRRQEARARRQAGARRLRRLPPPPPRRLPPPPQRRPPPRRTRAPPPCRRARRRSHQAAAWAPTPRRPPRRRSSPRPTTRPHSSPRHSRRLRPSSSRSRRSRSRCPSLGPAVASIEDFDKIDIRVGRVVEVEEFPEARKPAWKLRVDFGSELGIRRTSAQVTNYSREELEGRLVLGVVNFPPRQIGPVNSEVLVLGVPDEEGRVILLKPSSEVPLGGRMF